MSAPFDILGPLPTGTTVLEASAGTGKTYAVGALVTRYVAEGVPLQAMLVITFGRAASQELRDRVRAQLVAAERALADPSAVEPGHDLIDLLLTGTADELRLRRSRIQDALAGFDAATIATTHQFCQLVLRSLGVAGDTDSRAELVENLEELTAEVVDDLYLARFSTSPDEPPISRDLAGRVAAVAVEDSHAEVMPAASGDTSVPAVRAQFARDVRAEVDRRKRQRGILSYDDLLSRLATALESADSAARQRMRQRWQVVLVDEFQDTDPVQWQVLDRAFTGAATMVLIGDPKQAIYGFRGGDIVTYLEAARTAGEQRTLAVNWRSDAPLVDSLQQLMVGTQLGDEGIVVHPVRAHHQGSRLVGAPRPEPFRVRELPTALVGAGKSGTPSIGDLRAVIARDLADDIAALLTSAATFDGRPIRAGDVAILMQSLNQVQPIRDALAERGVATVITGGSGVMRSAAGDAWLCLLEALEQPNRAGRVRSVALSPFLGRTPSELAAGGDTLTDSLAEEVRRWLDLYRIRGIAAVHEAIVAKGLAARVLAQPGGERLLTDLHHIAQVLHEVARRERFGLPALLAWLRHARESASADSERSRRLDTDAAAVQISTIHGSKGLQYPIVYLPVAFNRWINDSPLSVRYHDERGRRCVDVGGNPSADTLRRVRAEDDAEELRLTYVALTRAQSQVVVWSGQSRDAAHGGVSRLILGRRPGQVSVPASVAMPVDDSADLFAAWAAAGAFAHEVVEPGGALDVLPAGERPRLRVRDFTRTIDETWRRTSYSGLIRADEQLVVDHESEPEDEGTTDEGAGEDEQLPGASETPPEDSPLSPMDGLPMGATFGSLVHGVLEHADPQATDLAAELHHVIESEQRYWSVDVETDTLVEAMLPMQTTPLGPLADNLSLVDIGRRDRLCELDFEFPLLGGDRAGERSGDVTLAAFADALEAHLPADDPMRAYAVSLRSPGLGGQVLRGYLSGSIDVVLRVRGADGDRFVVVDYKTNTLGDPDRPLTAWDYRAAALTEAMLHSHYPLQAMLYSVVLHRYLRWRLPDYDPERHLGGVLYLYVRGMCGPETPVLDGQPAGVFAWHPPASLVLALSDLLDGRRP